MILCTVKLGNMKLFGHIWFAAAYLEPTNEFQGFLHQQSCYSLGSIALWNRAENVALIQTVPKSY